MKESGIRKAAVAGRFYPSSKEDLGILLDEIYGKVRSKINPEWFLSDFYGAVVPHAGYIYSAYQAIPFFEILKKSSKKIDTFVIINPNHTGFGEAISMSSHTHWETPFGLIAQDMELIDLLDFPFSDIAHQHEHSGEVMVPMLQHFVSYAFKIVVITLSQQNPEQAKLLANKIKQASEKLDRKIALIASSDFTHFKDAQTGYRMDELVLEQIKNQDIKKLYETVRQNNISVCGYGPIMCLMEYSALSGKYSTQILARGHSGEVHTSDKVVDYISILYFKN